MQATYLDNNATTRCDDAVVAAMTPLLAEHYGNASSTHHFGAAVGAQIDEARAAVAQLIGAREREVVFTSGGTEADVAALRGVLAARPDKRHLVISTVEHPAVAETADELEREGVEVSRIAVDAHGAPDLQQLRDTLRDDTALVSIMLANNETGVVLPLGEICQIAAERRIPVHTDAVNAVGKLPIDVAQLGVSLLSLSAHKFHGPKGVGALYIRRGAPFVPLMAGGGQERGRRGGTLNTPGIVGLGTAARHAMALDEAALRGVATLRDALEDRIASEFPEAVIIGRRGPRLVNTTCVCFPGVEGAALVVLLSERGVCVSSGAACASGSLEPSPVLQAMGVPAEVAQGELRLSLSKYTTEADIDRLLSVLPEVVQRVAGV